MTSFLNDLISTFPAFTRAAWMTLQITGISLALALVIGLIFALMKVSGLRSLGIIYNGYVGIIRGTQNLEAAHEYIRIRTMRPDLQLEYLNVLPYPSAAPGLIELLEPEQAA